MAVFRASNTPSTDNHLWAGRNDFYFLHREMERHFCVVLRRHLELPYLRMVGSVGADELVQSRDVAFGIDDVLSHDLGQSKYHAQQREVVGSSTPLEHFPYEPTTLPHTNKGIRHHESVGTV